MKQVFIKDIKAGDKVTEFFALRKAELLEKDGRFRLSMELGDSTGRIPAVLWDATKEYGALYPAGVIVKIKGLVGIYREKEQIRVEQIRLAKEGEYDLADFFRASSKTYEELAAALDGVIDRVENSYLQKLLKAIFGDSDLRGKYLKAPAAKLLHHDTIGGLAEHSLSMAEVIIRLADHYPKLDRDILLCGALLHDIGKIWEYEITASIDFTDAGRLVGHINQGDEFVTSMADTIDNFPDDLLVHLRHLIISHQGEKEKGSPVVPMTPEAMFLHYVDELDARMGALEKIRERTEGAGWSQYSQIFERFFFFGRPDVPSGQPGHPAGSPGATTPKRLSEPSDDTSDTDLPDHPDDDPGAEPPPPDPTKQGKLL
ncbi:MAG: HD domain-containing protein [candidate division Zixibacteria bacterium]|nr:HD domain-containing protein [candidate division Zixibacteria bacterium]